MITTRDQLRPIVSRRIESRKCEATPGEVSLLTTRCLDNIGGLAPGGSLTQQMEVADATLELWLARRLNTAPSGLFIEEDGVV